MRETSHSSHTHSIERRRPEGTAEWGGVFQDPDGAKGRTNMKKLFVTAMAMALGAATAVNVPGTETTPLTMQVNNYCEFVDSPSGENGFWTQASGNRTRSTHNLGTITAVTSSTTGPITVLNINCNFGTALNITTPTSLNLTNQLDNSFVFQMNTSAWSQSNPLTMSFTGGTATTLSNGFANYYNYEVKASFKVGGQGASNAAWGMPGGLYTGNLVVQFNYNE